MSQRQFYQVSFFLFYYFSLSLRSPSINARRKGEASLSFARLVLRFIFPILNRSGTTTAERTNERTDHGLAFHASI